MNKVILRIGGMSCSACSSGLEKYLRKQEGIETASVNLVLQQAFIEYDDYKTLEDLERFIKEAGFESLGVYHGDEETQDNLKKVYLILYGILAFVVLYISMSHMVGLPVIPYLHMLDYPIYYSVILFLLTIPFLIYGLDIFRSGIKNLFHRSPNMDTLVTLGVGASFFYSVFGMFMILLGNSTYVENLYFESVAIIIFFIKFGRYIDGRSKEKTKVAIQELVKITPSKALLKTESGEKEVTIDEIKKGDILIAKPGMKIAVDGIIISGETHLDEAFITGESIPVKKEKGKNVIAGSINYDGYIEYKAEKIGKDSTISEIVRLVVEATNTKPPIAKLADKVSGYFVPGIMIIAVLSFVVYLLLGNGFQIAFHTFVTVLVVACPCALGLATPLAIVVSEGICAKNGILVKKSETLENSHKVEVVVFDKTGTLTYGNLKISKILNFSDYSLEKLLSVVSSLENKSDHPIATAFKNYQKEHHLSSLDVFDFENLAGLGLTGVIDSKNYYIGNRKLLVEYDILNPYEEEEKKLSENGNSIVYVATNHQVVALIGVKDIVRKQAKSVIYELKLLHKKVIMLTGDNELTAFSVAAELGIDDVIANVMPKDKVEVIQELMKDKKVMMVGDGINDAPSLATSFLGVSVSSGTDIANNSADVILMNANLINLVNLIVISQKTIRNIKQNLFWAFFYNACMIPIAVGLFSSIGISMNPMIAGFAMTISSLTVVFNALRLKKIKLRRYSYATEKD